MEKSREDYQQDRPTKTSSPNNQNTGSQKSPGSNSLLPLIGCSLSQSSNTDIADLITEDTLDISEVDPKSWDNLLENLESMSSQISRSKIRLSGENVPESFNEDEQEALVRECYSHLQSQPAGKILDLAPSQSDSGLGDNSLISGSDIEIPAENDKSENKTTDVSGNSNSLTDVEIPVTNDKETENDQIVCRYPKRNIERVNYKDIEVPEDDEFICKYFKRTVLKQ